jgi:ABC-type transport system substrate-binding protein
MSTTDNVRQPVIQYIKSMLGDGMIDVDLDPIHYNTAIDKAFAKYRQKSSNSVEESFAFLTLEQDVNEYSLSQEVVEVREVFRRSIGSRTGGGDGGSLFEPFNLAYSNTYLLSSSNMGGLATYYAFASYQKLVGKMFGSYIQFTWNAATKKLTIMQRPRGEETVLLWLYNYKPEFVILNDPYSGVWIKDYALAISKQILGEARSKFSQIASPQGGTTLNGDALKTESAAMIEKLELELANYATGEKPMTFVFG